MPCFLMQIHTLKTLVGVIFELNCQSDTRLQRHFSLVPTILYEGRPVQCISDIRPEVGPEKIGLITNMALYQMLLWRGPGEGEMADMS